jgi:hypothetical protein
MTAYIYILTLINIYKHIYIYIYIKERVTVILKTAYTSSLRPRTPVA